jgi:UDP-GlcNAc:undecaprenyl-phosphate GlcNAc-1-phosphate transferase
LDFADYLIFILGATLPSFALAWAFGYVVRRNAPRWGLVDQPSAAHKAHATPTPLGGGLAIAGAVVLSFALGQSLLFYLAAAPHADWLDLPDWIARHVSGLTQRAAQLWILLAAAVALAVLGLADDRFRLPWAVRLVLQTIVAALIIWQTEWRLTAFIPLPAITFALSVIWIVALINSFNMLDNMDGLSAGVAAICGGMLAAALLIAPDPQTAAPQLFTAGFLLVLVGSLIGFLLHNRPPARLFMGDAGSYFIGFCLAAMSMQATYADYSGGTRHAVLVPLCIFAVPLYDMASVIFIRLREGRSPFQADLRHFSHRLVDLGFTRPQAVLIIYLMTAATSLVAVAMHQVELAGAIALIAVVACVLGLVAILENAPRRK